MPLRTKCTKIMEIHKYVRNTHTETQTHRHPATSHYPTIHSLSTRYPSTPDGPGHPDCQLYPSPCRLHTFPLRLTNIVATLVATLPLPPTTVAHCRRHHMLACSTACSNITTYPSSSSVAKCEISIQHRQYKSVAKQREMLGFSFKSSRGMIDYRIGELT